MCKMFKLISAYSKHSEDELAPYFHAHFPPREPDVVTVEVIHAAPCFLTLFWEGLHSCSVEFGMIMDKQLSLVSKYK